MEHSRGAKVQSMNLLIDPPSPPSTICGSKVRHALSRPSPVKLFSYGHYSLHVSPLALMRMSTCQGMEGVQYPYDWNDLVEC